MNWKFGLETCPLRTSTNCLPVTSSSCCWMCCSPNTLAGTPAPHSHPPRCFATPSRALVFDDAGLCLHVFPEFLIFFSSNCFICCLCLYGNILSASASTHFPTEMIKAYLISSDLISAGSDDSLQLTSCQHFISKLLPMLFKCSALGLG